MLVAAGVVAAAIALSMLAVSRGHGPGGHTAVHRPVSGAAAVTAVPAGFSPESIAFADDLHGLLLGPVCTPTALGDGPCRGATVATTDGGLSWHFYSDAPPPPLLPAPGCGASGGGHGGGCTARLATPQLAMLGDRVAVAYSRLGYDAGAPPGDSHLYVTRDGGRSWAAETVPGQVEAVTGGGVHSYLLVVHCPPDMTSSATAVCPHSVEESTDLGRTWRPTLSQPTLPDGYNSYIELSAAAGGMLWATFYPNSAAGAHFAASADGGASWRSVANPCPRRAITLDHIAALGSVVWLICGHRPGFERTQAWVSTNAGLSWTPRAKPMAIDVAPVDFVLTAADSGWTVAYSLAGASGETLYHSADGGRTWGGVAAPSHASHVLFTDPQHGWLTVAAPTGDTLWRTTDGGQDWQPVAL